MKIITLITLLLFCAAMPAAADQKAIADTIKTSDANQINELAIKHGMITLQQDGIQKVMKGITTTEEVLCVTRTIKRNEDVDDIIIGT